MTELTINPCPFCSDFCMSVEEDKRGDLSDNPIRIWSTCDQSMEAEKDDARSEWSQNLWEAVNDWNTYTAPGP